MVDKFSNMPSISEQLNYFQTFHDYKQYCNKLVYISFPLRISKLILEMELLGQNWYEFVILLELTTCLSLMFTNFNSFQWCMRCVPVLYPQEGYQICSSLLMWQITKISQHSFNYHFSKWESKASTHYLMGWFIRDLW